MAWDSAFARQSLRVYAMEVASDAHDMGGDDLLYSSAGAAYYASSGPTLDCHSRITFIKFVIQHIGLDEEYANEWANKIEQGQLS